MALHPRLYRYVGRYAIRCNPGRPGIPIGSLADLQAWIGQAERWPDTELVPATFVIDCSNSLLLGDRRSEHVACAAGQPVKSAGEIFFTTTSEAIVVAEITNQSTGY